MIVFVTSKGYTGNLGGLAGADAELTSGTLRAKVTLTETGATVPTNVGLSGNVVAGVWTDTSGSETPAPASYDCAAWTDGTSVSSGVLGGAQVGNSRWTYASIIARSDTFNLYCVQQWRRRWLNATSRKWTSFSSLVCG